MAGTSDRQAELERMVEQAQQLPGVADIISVYGAAAQSMSGAASIPTFVSRSSTSGNG